MATARNEYHQGTAHGIGVEYLTAHRRQTIDASPEIHRLHGHEDPHVGGDLDHARRRKNSCTIGRRSLGLALGSRSTSRAPEPSTSSRVPPSPGPAGEASGASSTNVGAGTRRRLCPRTPESRPWRP